MQVARPLQSKPASIYLQLSSGLIQRTTQPSCPAQHSHSRTVTVSCQALQAQPATESPASSTTVTAPFHLAFPVRDVSEARDFYGGKLKCTEGRSAASWVDFSLFGHQIVCHEVKGYNAASSHNDVDGDPVPVPHFGLALSVQDFHSFAEQVNESGINFIIKPHLRFEGQPGEQYTMFFKDPSGNALEFKAMTKPENLFARYYVQ